MKVQIILSLFVYCSIHKEAFASANAKHVKLSKIREIVALLQGISQQTRIEGEKEQVLYEDVKRFCEARQDTSISPEAQQAEEQPEQQAEELPAAVSTLPPSPQVYCALPVVTVGVKSWSGANCASGTHNVLQGTVCQISAASGYSCTSPGLCGSDGVFASIASCQATCASHSCPIGFALISSRSSSTAVTNSNCCQATCASHSCPSGFARISSRSSSTTVTDDNCCQATCASYSCPAGFSLISSRSSSITVSNANCCQATCASYSCPEGFEQISSRSFSTTLTNANCCQATCATHLCPSGYVFNPWRSKSTTVTNANCCLATCASHSCPNGYLAISSMSSSTKVSDAQCCQATCASHLCPSGYAHIASQSSSTVVSDARCCQARRSSGHPGAHSKRKAVTLSTPRDRAHPQKQVSPTKKASRHADISQNREVSTALISTGVDSDPIDDEDMGQALQSMDDLLKGNASDGAAAKDDESVVHESEALESAIAGTEDNLKRESTQEEAIVKEQLKDDLKDYAKMDSDKAKLDNDRASSETEMSGLLADDTTEALTLPESGDPLPSETDNIAHIRIAKVLPRSVLADNATDESSDISNSDDESDLENDDSSDVPASFLQVVQDQAISIPQADLDAVWKSLKTIEDQSRAGLNMVDLLGQVAAADPERRASSGHSSHRHMLAALQDQGKGMEQQCHWLLQNFEQRQENRRKVNMLLKRAKAILGRTRIPARRLRGLH